MKKKTMMELCREYELLDYICHFCKAVILDGDADEETCEAVLMPAEWACYAANKPYFDMDALGFMVSVCAACAERTAGPDWREKGQAAIAENDAFNAELKARGCTIPGATSVQ